ncbi:hypothetical protein E4634_19960 [Mangrovimicrobium sediminis]|uniref:Uncharacterized protein n=1 Tax=Mangrovimicrobium sediminis TaxID=2562682 RepID=A0A4Z0LV11_9GAMM|nr:hypothetical protein [Haliea sp. SAOS-164]TGD71120.1 hypothetical protein E4634_19960 [Haliea sp. SAOS-164]
MATPSISKARLVFGLYLLVLIVVLELALHYFHLPAWPAFMVMILFFEAHMNRQRAPHLLVGALVGVACYVATVHFVQLAAPTLGLFTAKLLFICLVVYAIVALGEVLPVLFNNYAFLFYLVSGLAARDATLSPAPLTWAAVALGGGALVILGIGVIGRLVAASAAPAAPAPESGAEH